MITKIAIHKKTLITKKNNNEKGHQKLGNNTNYIHMNILDSFETEYMLIIYEYA